MKIEQQTYKGYTMGLAVPIEFAKAISNKMKLLAQEQPDSKWSNLSAGFELGVAEQLKERKQELVKVKSKGRSKSHGRTR